MKKVKVFFRIIQEGSVTVEVSDGYNEADLREAAQLAYDDGDLHCADQFEVTDYEEE